MKPSGPRAETVEPGASGPLGRSAPPGSDRDSAEESDRALLERITGGDDTAFCRLVDRYWNRMLRFACIYTADPSVAEDAVQDAWVAFIDSIHRFEGRSEPSTWIFKILLNRLRTRLRREGRSIPFSRYFRGGTDELAVEPDRFLAEDHPRWPGHWRVPPRSWGGSPEERLVAAETRAEIERLLQMLPAAQREVVTLRDVEGWSSAEVRKLLGLSESNQRVLLHRGRSRLRAGLERYFAEEV